MANTENSKLIRWRTIPAWCSLSLLLMMATGATPLLGASTAAPLPDRCTSGDNGILGVSARIEFIIPSSAHAIIRSAEGQQFIGVKGSCIRARETVLLPADVNRVLIFSGNQVIEKRPSDPPFVSPGVISSVVTGASEFLGRLYGALSGDVWAPAAQFFSRGDIKPMKPIRVLINATTPQRFVPDLAGDFLLLGWSGGRPSWICSSDRVEVQPPTAEPGMEPTCEVPVTMESHRVSVRDGDGRELSWELRLSSEADIPRPAWLPSALLHPTANDRAAWGAWLLDEDMTEWKLFGLSMLASAETDAWVASQIVARLRRSDRCIAAEVKPGYVPNGPC